MRVVFFLCFIVFIHSSCEGLIKSEAIKYDKAVDCIKSFPYKKWIKNDAIFYVKKLLDMYIYRDIVTDSGHPWNQSIHVIDEVVALSQREDFENDFDFHNELKNTVAKLRDAHTAYLPPTCYGFHFYQRFPIRQLDDGTFEITEFWNEVDIELEIPEMFKKVYNTRTDLFSNPYKGSKILAINGKDPFTAINEYSKNECHYSRDPLICYNQVLKSEWFRRNINRQNIPSENSIILQIEYNGTVFDLDSPWIASPSLDYRFDKMDYLCGYLKKDQDIAIQTRRRTLFDSYLRPDLEEEKLEREQEEKEKSASFFSIFNPFLPSKKTVVKNWIKESLNVYEINRLLTESQISDKKKEERKRRNIEAGQVPKGYEQIPLTFENDNKYFRLFISNTTKTALLKVITFMPSFDILGPQDNEHLMDALASFQAYFDQLFSAFEEMKNNGAKKVIVDVRGNVGGVGCLAFVLLRYLSPYAPHDPSPNADLIYTKLGDAMHCKLNILDKITFFGQDRTPVSSDWFNGGPTRVRGKAKSSQYSKMIHFGCAVQFLVVGAQRRWEESPIMFEPENLMVLSDGTCGSTCGVFVKLVQYLELGRVVTHGGTYGLPESELEMMNTASFPGGAVMTGSQLLNELSLYATVCSVEDYVFPEIRSNAIITFAWMELYPWDPLISAFELEKVNDEKPLGHTLKPADFHLASYDFTDDIFSDPKLLEIFDTCAPWEIKLNPECAPQNLPFPHAIYGNPCDSETGDFSTVCELKGCEGGFYLSEGKDECITMPEEYDLLGMAARILFAGVLVLLSVLCMYLVCACCLCCMCLGVILLCVFSAVHIKKKWFGRGRGRASAGRGNETNRPSGDQELGMYSRITAEEDSVEDREDVVDVMEVISHDDEKKEGLLDGPDSGLF